MRARILRILPTLIPLAILAAPLAAQENTTPRQRAELVEQGKFAEAFEAYRAALADDPDDAVLLYNTGLTAYLSGQPKEAIAPWAKLKAAEPDDWRVRSKLVQAYDAAGQLKKRDEELEGLYRLRKESKDEAIRRLKHFVRDQFAVGQRRVMAFEYFEPAGEDHIRWSFHVIEPDGKTVHMRLYLGSNDVTTAIARETKEIKPDQRLYDLDGYRQEGETETHTSYAFYVDPPKYDAVKEAVKQIVEGKRKPLSGSVSPRQ